MNVTFRHINGQNIKIGLPLNATVFDACKSLSNAYRFSDMHIHLVSIKESESKKYYCNEDKIQEILLDGPNFIVFTIIPKMSPKFYQTNGNLSRRAKSTKNLKYRCKNSIEIIYRNKRNQLRFDYSSYLYEEYCECLQHSPRDFQMKVNQIAQLGFQKDDIKEALRMAHYNVQQATDILVNMNDDNMEPTHHRSREMGPRRGIGRFRGNIHNNAHLGLSSFVFIDDSRNFINNPFHQNQFRKNTSKPPQSPPKPPELADPFSSEEQIHQKSPQFFLDFNSLSDDDKAKPFETKKYRQPPKYMSKVQPLPDEFKSPQRKKDHLNHWNHPQPKQEHMKYQKPPKQRKEPKAQILDSDQDQQIIDISISPPKHQVKIEFPDQLHPNKPLELVRSKAMDCLSLPPPPQPKFSLEQEEEEDPDIQNISNESESNPPRHKRFVSTRRFMPKISNFEDKE